MFTPPQWLFEVAGCWQEQEAAAVYLHPERPKHARWVTCPVSRLARQELGVATTCTHFLEACADCCNTWAVHYHAAAGGDGGG